MAGSHRLCSRPVYNGSCTHSHGHGLCKASWRVTVGVLGVSEVVVRFKDHNDGQQSTLTLGLVVLLVSVIALCILLAAYLHCRHYKLHSQPGS